jgi:hypothetical protein
MILIAELTKKFGSRDIYPYGPVIIIPQEHFQKKWTAELGIQGHRCIETFLGANKAVTLVKKGIDPDVKAEFTDVVETSSGNESEPAAMVPKRTYKRRVNKTATRLYTPIMERRLIGLYNSGATYPQMAKIMCKEFPQKNFTERSLALKIHDLRKAIRKGRLLNVTLKPRQKGKHVTPVKRLPVPSAIEVSKVHVTYETADGYSASVSGPTLKGCCLLLKTLMDAVENVQ